MVFIMAASSVDHALDTLTPENRKNYNEKIYSIPGLSLNPITKNPRKIGQNLLSRDVAEKTDIIIWHDVLNNSFSKYQSNNFRALLVCELLEILKSLENKLQALVYCHRIRTPDIFDVRKTQNVSVFRNETDFFSTRKQNDPRILNEMKAIHQRPEFELEYLDIILRKQTTLAQITAKSRPKWPSKRALKALKNAASNQWNLFLQNALLLWQSPDFIVRLKSQQLFSKVLNLCPDLTVRLTFKTTSLLPSLRVMRYSRFVPPS